MHISEKSCTFAVPYEHPTAYIATSALPIMHCSLCPGVLLRAVLSWAGERDILATDENDDSYDELKKEVIARQVLRGETPYAQYIKDRYDQPAITVHSVQKQVLHRPLVLAIDTVTGACHLLAEDGTILAEARIAMVDSTWYMWLSVDPLADKNISNSPYMYCGGNPIMLIDPDGRDWYEADDGSAVLWRKGNDATITIGNEFYRNIGESYSHQIGNTTYNYNQNSLSSISANTMNSSNFISQFAKDDWDGTSANLACQKACDAMLTSAGFTSNAYSSSNVIVDNNGGSAGEANGNAARVIGNLTASLYAGYPAKVSVDCKPNSSSHADKIGDHFIVIMGITEFVTNGTVTGANYRFFDPGTKHLQYGTGENAILQLYNGRLVGAAPYGSHRPYIVTSIRFCQ